MIYRIIGLCQLLLLLICPIALGADVNIISDDSNAHVEWTQTDTRVARHYIQLIFLDKTPNVIYPRDGTKILAYVVGMPRNDAYLPRPRSGHFVAQIMACDDAEENCSRWVQSDVEGSPQPWIIFWKPLNPPKEKIIIEDEGVN
ncbi:MAG: hypothetical protein ACFFCW_00435 [Candidatus Hodarchaeota archaeon]